MPTADSLTPAYGQLHDADGRVLGAAISPGPRPPVLPVYPTFEPLPRELRALLDARRGAGLLDQLLIDHGPRVAMSWR